MTSPEVSLQGPTKKSPRAPGASNRIVFHVGPDAYEIPVEYHPINGARIPALITEMAEALYSMATCQHRRARGESEVGNGGVDLAYETQEATGRFTRAWKRVSFFLQG